MKLVILIGVAAACLAAAAVNAVPTEWTVRVGPRAATYQAERYHGDSLALRATMTYNGLPLPYQGEARLYAQTNGMGSVWWDLAPAEVSSNVLSAVWSPLFDTGADVVDIFLGAPSNYQAHARIRFLPSPGPVPNELPLPVPVIDFSAIEVVNAPWLGADAATNAANHAVSSFAATNNVLNGGPYVKKTSPTPAGQTLYGGFNVRGWIESTGTVSVVSGGPSLLEIRPPYASMDVGAFRLGGPDGGWTFDEAGFHRQFGGNILEDVPDGPAISFPEDAWETGGTLALRSDINAAFTNALSGRIYDFSTNVGLYTGVRDLILALGGSVTNFPAINGGN